MLLLPRSRPFVRREPRYDVRLHPPTNHAAEHGADRSGSKAPIALSKAASDHRASDGAPHVPGVWRRGIDARRGWLAVHRLGRTVVDGRAVDDACFVVVPMAVAVFVVPTVCEGGRHCGERGSGRKHHKHFTGGFHGSSPCEDHDSSNESRREACAQSVYQCARNCYQLLTASSRAGRILGTPPKRGLGTNYFRGCFISTP